MHAHGWSVEKKIVSFIELGSIKSQSPMTTWIGQIALHLERTIKVTGRYVLQDGEEDSVKIWAFCTKQTMLSARPFHFAFSFLFEKDESPCRTLCNAEQSADLLETFSNNRKVLNRSHLPIHSLCASHLGIKEASPKPVSSLNNESKPWFLPCLKKLKNYEEPKHSALGQWISLASRTTWCLRPNDQQHIW